MSYINILNRLALLKFMGKIIINLGRIVSMKKIAIAFFIVFLAFFTVYSEDTIKTYPYKKSADTVKIPTEVKPKPPTNWSKIKDLFL
jgi:hypothetical protein